MVPAVLPIMQGREETNFLAPKNLTSIESEFSLRFSQGFAFHFSQLHVNMMSVLDALKLEYTKFNLRLHKPIYCSTATHFLT